MLVLVSLCLIRALNLAAGLACRLSFWIAEFFCAFQLHAENLGSSASSQRGSFIPSTMILFLSHKFLPTLFDWHYIQLSLDLLHP